VIVLGIDPGLEGGLVALSGTEILLAEVMPVIDIGGTRRKTNRVMNVGVVVQLIEEMMALAGARGVELVVGIEKQFPGENDGKSSAAKTMTAFGQLLGIVAAKHLRHEVPHKNSWKAILAGVPGEGKERSVLCVQRRLPKLNLTPGKKRVPHDGVAEAACLCLFLQKELHIDTQPNGAYHEPAVDPFA
jgi:Holliday junction resolvasome RuvABC endonuclease subunit